jgi:hypothetical protein
MKLNFNFYTTWSNFIFYFILFFLVVVKIFKIQISNTVFQICIAFFVNIIAVGIIGNCILLYETRNKDNLTVEKMQDLIQVNFVMHFIPLILSIVASLFLYTYDIEYKIPLITATIFFLLWTIVPDSFHHIFFKKIDDMYGNPPIYTTFSIFIFWAVIIFLLKKNKCKN